MDRRTRKLMTIHKVLHPRDLYLSRKERERETVSIEDCVDASIRGLEDYKAKKD